jgi:hypothetical protein
MSIFNPAKHNNLMADKPGKNDCSGIFSTAEKRSVNPKLPMASPISHVIDQRMILRRVSIGCLIICEDYTSAPKSSQPKWNVTGQGHGFLGSSKRYSYNKN